MTPAARLQAAITCVDRVLDGQPTEAALLAWSRGARYAGSKDRAAVRDIVFDIRRKWASCAWVGGAEDAPARVWGWCHLTGQDPAELFTGQGHAPEVWTGQADPRPLVDAPYAVQHDYPDWMAKIAPEGFDWTVLQDRAPITLRTLGGPHRRKAMSEQLGAAGFTPQDNPVSKRAITLTGHARGLMNTQIWAEGACDMQDAASQWALDLLGDLTGQSALDYCAGGGGKSIGLADQGARVVAHDVSAKRLAAVPDRAERLGLDIVCQTQLDLDQKFDLVVCDLPCSGSGTWRRTPDAKWALTPDALADYAQLQRDIVKKAQAYVAPGGRLAVMTCSVFEQESTGLSTDLQADYGVPTFRQMRFPDVWADGFFVSIWSGL